MPYYDVSDVSDARRSYSYFPNGTRYDPEGTYLVDGFWQRSFYNSPPRKAVVKRVSDTVAEPYSWFLDSYKGVKERALQSSGEFDSKLFRTDRGHTWDMQKFKLQHEPWTFKLGVGSNQLTFLNALPSLVPYDSGAVYQGFTVPSGGNLEAFGQLAYGRAAPRTAIFDLGVFLGELHEGIPKFVPQTFKKDLSLYKALGSDYLNAQFGWLPFLSAIQDFASALAHATERFVQPFGPYHRSYSQGDPVGSSAVRTFDTFVNHTVGSGYVPPNMRDALSLSGPLYSAETGAQVIATATSGFTQSTRQWFEGEFVILPKIGFNADSFTDRLDAVMKTDITPATLWELAPWSWLFDWFFHLGESIRTSELALDDRLLSTYAYAMEETTREHFVSLSNMRARFSSSNPYSGPSKAYYSWKSTRKQRIRANPFGFTVNPTTSLNTMQKAILGALSLTKGRF